MKEEKFYSQEEIDATISKLRDIGNTSDFTSKQYWDLHDVIQDSYHFSEEDFIEYNYVRYNMDYSDVTDYLNGMSERDLRNLFAEYGFQEGFSGESVKTLDDEQRVKLLTRLFKYFTSTRELEEFLGEKMVQRLNLML
jgi:CRISPR/Cas system-associated protein Csx1